MALNRDLKEEFGQEVYTGERNEQGLRHGRGKLRTPVYWYEGDWLEGLKHGQGVAKYKSGEEYEGQWVADKRQGKGSLIEKQFHGIFIEKYIGMFSGDKKEGQGEQTLKTGRIYDGQFKAGLFDGFGKIKTESNEGYAFSGYFKAGKFHGPGKESYIAGSNYEGEFKNGMKCGYGIFKGKSGYEYHGEWREGVKQGFGIEYNIPVIGNTPIEVDPADESFKKYLYEGEFWNNKRHGHGKYIEPTGDLYIGGWAEGKKQGLGLEYEKASEKWTLGIHSPFNPKIILESQERNVPEFWSSYHFLIPYIKGKENMNYEDKHFKGDFKNYYNMDTEKLAVFNIDTSMVKFIHLHEIFPKMKVGPLPREIPIKADFSKNHDCQLLPFLLALIRRPADLSRVLNPFSKQSCFFFLFNLYFHSSGEVQQYPLAVDDIVPLAKEGGNLYCQMERGDNVTLTMLEKAWAKYVYVCGLQERLQLAEPSFQYIDKIMRAFLGAPVVKLDTRAEDFTTEFQKLWRKGCFAFCYLRKGNKIINKESFEGRTYSLVDYYDSMGGEHAFVCQTSDETSQLGTTTRPQWVSIFKLIDHINKYFDKDEDNKDNEDEEEEIEQGEEGEEDLIQDDFAENEMNYFVRDLPDFQELFESVYISAYQTTQKTRHFSLTGDIASFEANKFEEYYLSFKTPTNDKVTIGIEQDHEYYETEEDTEKPIVPEMPPIRVVLARKPVFRDPKNVNINAEYQEELKRKAEADARQVQAVNNMPGLLEFLETQGEHFQENSLDSSIDSSVEDKEDKPAASESRLSLKKKTKTLTLPKDDPEEESLTDEKKNERLFDAMVSEYRNTLKYVDGFGQTKDRLIMLE